MRYADIIKLVADKKLYMDDGAQTWYMPYYLADLHAEIQEQEGDYVLSECPSNGYCIVRLNDVGLMTLPMWVEADADEDTL